MQKRVQCDSEGRRIFVAPAVNSLLNKVKTDNLSSAITRTLSVDGRKSALTNLFKSLEEHGDTEWENVCSRKPFSKIDRAKVERVLAVIEQVAIRLTGTEEYVWIRAKLLDMYTRGQFKSGSGEPSGFVTKQVKLTYDKLTELGMMGANAVHSAAELAALK